ncbi:MAG: type II secretion system minor pseudopilin GspI [Gammaproteobacteria bacterium]|nr:type II secretion system minor pseudopilin GspI [Gammaproteobacteria bacterium]
MNNLKLRLSLVRGMTLIEVMVALAVFSLAALAAVNVATEHMRSLSYIEQKTLALWVANNQLTQLQLDQKLPKLGDSKGEVEFAGNTWYWRQSGIKTPDPDFRMVRVSIFSSVDSKSSLAELTSYMVAK